MDNFVLFCTHKERKGLFKERRFVQGVLGNAACWWPQGCWDRTLPLPSPHALLPHNITVAESWAPRSQPQRSVPPKTLQQSPFLSWVSCYECREQDKAHTIVSLSASFLVAERRAVTSAPPSQACQYKYHQTAMHDGDDSWVQYIHVQTRIIHPLGRNHLPPKAIGGAGLAGKDILLLWSSQGMEGPPQTAPT